MMNFITGEKIDSLEWAQKQVASNSITTEQQRAIDTVKASAVALLAVIAEHVPQCADQSAAVRHIREAVMTANAAISNPRR